jgi:hypothetical protein
MLVKINNRGEAREFEILEREQIEEILNDLNPVEIYKKTLRDAVSYNHSGNAYAYIDARNGDVATTWLEKSNLLHPWDSFYEIIICDIETGYDNLDFNTPENLLELDNKDEMEKFQNSELDPESFIIEEYGQEELNERYENVYDYLSDNFDFNWDDIKEQLDQLYQN